MSTEDWFPICVFDEEPDWKRLGALHPNAYINGCKHRSGNYWYALAGVSDLPPLLENHAPAYSWPIDYEVPEDLTLYPAYADFVMKVGKVGRIAEVVSSGQVHYGVAVSMLAGVRTFVFENEVEYPALNLACVLNKGAVEGFGMSQGKFEFWWDNGTVQFRLALGPNFQDYESIQDHLDQLRALPFVDLEISHDDPVTLKHWPSAVWPQAWADPGELVGIGLEDSSYTWGRDWRDCYWKPAPNTQSASSHRLERWLGRPFEVTWLGRQLLGDWNKKYYADDA